MKRLLSFLLVVLPVVVATAEERRSMVADFGGVMPQELQSHWRDQGRELAAVLPGPLYLWLLPQGDDGSVLPGPASTSHRGLVTDGWGSPR